MPEWHRPEGYDVEEINILNFNIFVTWHASPSSSLSATKHFGHWGLTIDCSGYFFRWNILKKEIYEILMKQIWKMKSFWSQRVSLKSMTSKRISKYTIPFETPTRGWTSFGATVILKWFVEKFVFINLSFHKALKLRNPCISSWMISRKLTWLDRWSRNLVVWFYQSNSIIILDWV